ncbi:hypothetical protein C922_05455 [Plasmodium inui San Antonio 1]|uniref:Plasmodium RESA N-terminal domain-containing protein n=1 Tax=Plasmodium inui San Antonio 1 TaxID=1237626 RepID=W6ZXX6_9APIC|nr:hypothetical protein C922_05455 [Plasmodium inui San Antonio 1]EUD64163.1 hypothetical protein C922_05455 [Plasmodium inui San Antonio 1]
MVQIQERNLSELNENGCSREGDSDKNVSSSDSEADDDVLSVFDEMDLEDYEEEDDFCNIFSPTSWASEMISTSDVTEEELDELISNMQEVPSKNEIIKMWKRAYALEVQTMSKMLISLFEYYEELKQKHRVREKLAFTHWDSVMCSCFDVLAKREEEYSKLFNGFIMKDELTKQELVNFLNNCKKEAAEFRESLETFAKKEFDGRIIPRRGD